MDEEKKLMDEQAEQVTGGQTGFLDIIKKAGTETGIWDIFKSVGSNAIYGSSNSTTLPADKDSNENS